MGGRITWNVCCCYEQNKSGEANSESRNRGDRGDHVRLYNNGQKITIDTMVEEKITLEKDDKIRCHEIGFFAISAVLFTCCS